MTVSGLDRVEASALRLPAALAGAAEAAARVGSCVWFSAPRFEPLSVPVTFLMPAWVNGLVDSPGRRLSTGAQLRTQDGEAGRRSADAGAERVAELRVQRVKRV